MINIILVDDHALYREGVRFSLQKMDNLPINIIGEAASGKEFFLMLAAGKVPDMVLLDIMLPDTSGVEIARRLKKEYPDVMIIMLSAEVSEELISELLNINVEGYLSKMAHRADIQTAIRTVIGGCRYYGRSVAKMMYDIYLAQQEGYKQLNSKKNKTSSIGKSINQLTKREKEIICLLCDGLQTKEVADKLNVSPRTVETHKNKILLKLGFSRVTDLVKYAIKKGLVEL